MSSHRHFPLYWGRYKLNPTITLEVESNENVNQSYEIELSSISSTNPESKKQLNRRNGNHVSIDIPIDQKDPYTIRVPWLLQKHFNCLYNIGVFPYNYATDRISWTICILHQVPFWIFSTMSLIDALRIIKSNFVYVHRGDLYGYTFMSYVVLKALIRLYFVYMLVCNRARVEKVTKTIRTLDGSMENIVCNRYSKFKENWILAGIWTFTFVGSLLGTIFGYVSISSGWSLENTVTDKAFEFSQVIFLWTSNSTQVEWVEDELYNEYGLVISYMSAFLGFSSAILELCGRIYDCLIDDLILLLAATMYILMNDFKFEMGPPTTLPSHSEIVWKHYRMLRNISEDIDSAFGKLLKIVNFSNLIRCGYFLLIITMDSTFDINFFLFLLTIIIKVGVTNIVAVKASSKNKEFRRWIQQTYLEQPCVVVGNKYFQTSLVLDELTTNPIGLGSDSFHVDENFAIKFAGIVASYFMFLAESKEKSSV